MKSVLRLTAVFAVTLLTAFSGLNLAHAQEGSDLHHVTFDGHTLAFPAALTNAVSVIAYDEPVPNVNRLEQAPRLHIRLGGVEMDSMPFGAVELFRLDEADGFQAADSFARLAEILDERPDLDAYLAENAMLPTTYPFLETDRSVYTFSTRAAYFESADYSGVVSINARVYNLSSGAVFMRYNLEAISSDGVWGVSAHFDLRADYPQTLQSLGDPDLYAEAVKTFLLETPADGFTPPLDLLDQVFAGISLEE